MENKGYSNNSAGCSVCGRPFPTAAPTTPCGCDVRFREYGENVEACIRKKQPGCPYTAVIPLTTVETIDGITKLRDCFVHVISTNTTFYVDDKGRLVVTWAGPVEVDSYDVATNPLGLRSQFLFTTINGQYSEVYFDKTGTGHVMGREA